MGSCMWHMVRVQGIYFILWIYNPDITATVLPRNESQIHHEFLTEDPLFLAARRPYEEPNMRHDLGRMEVKCQSCGALHWMDEKLSDSSINNPVFGMCCDSGKVEVPMLRDPPPTLKSFLENNDQQGKNFRENIWKYNRAFAFTSLQIREDHSINQYCRGPPVFRIQGELHHCGGPLFPATDRSPTYAQLYFYDPRTSPSTKLWARS